jgi:Na+/phosphate symporter
MMKQITINIPENDYATVVQFLETFNAVEIISDTVETSSVSKKSKKDLKFGIDNTPFDRTMLRKQHRMTLENITQLRAIFKNAPFDTMEKSPSK